MEFLLRRRGSKRLVRALLLEALLAAQSLPTVAKLLKLVNQFYFFMYYRVRKTKPEEELLLWETWGKPPARADPAGAMVAGESGGLGGGGGGGGGTGELSTSLVGAIVDDHFGSAGGGATAAASPAAMQRSPPPPVIEAAAAAAQEDQDPVINQVEFYHTILMPLQDAVAQAQQAAGPGGKEGERAGAGLGGGGEGSGLTTSYLVAVLLEYIRSLHEHNIRVHHSFSSAVSSDSDAGRWGLLITLAASSDLLCARAPICQLVPLPPRVLM
eukprot:COSAG01_NODE_6287_length_3752_cov_23.350123_4_plen_270_part_00